MKTILMASAIVLTGTAAMATPTLTVKMSEAGFADNIFKPGDVKAGVTTIGNAVTYAGSFGDFSINFTSGQSGSNPTSINLNSLDTSKSKFSGLKTLTLAITLTDVTSPVGLINWLSTFSGTLGKNTSAVFNSYIDASNTAFGTATALSTLSCSASTSQQSCSNGSDNKAALGLAPYSITEIVSLTTRQGTQNNVNATLDGTSGPGTPVPEPMSMALLGAGLAGLGMIRRTRRG